MAPKWMGSCRTHDCQGHSTQGKTEVCQTYKAKLNRNLILCEFLGEILEYKEKWHVYISLEVWIKVCDFDDIVKSMLIWK